MELIAILNAERRDWMTAAQVELDKLKNFVLCAPGGVNHLRGFSALVGTPYEPERLEKWGIYALNDVLEKDDLKWALDRVAEGKEAFLVEQIKLPITRPPRVKSILLYCQARGIISQHENVKDAKASLIRMVEQYNRAHFFPLAGVYRWEQDHWDQIRSLF